MFVFGVQPLKLMTLDTPPQHDSDSMIPPQHHHAPHSYVPFMKAPSSIGTIPLNSSGGGQPGSQPGADSLHAGPRSSGTSRSSGEDLALFSMVGLKDWELDLDALEVRANVFTVPLYICISTWKIWGTSAAAAYESAAFTSAMLL